MDIVEFLGARYAERRALAEAAQRMARSDAADGAHWNIGGGDAVYCGHVPLATGPFDAGIDYDIAAHVVAHDPAFVLADLAAKERRLERHRPGSHGAFCVACEGLWPCEDVLNDAAVFANHPDYDPAWAVDA